MTCDIWGLWLLLLWTNQLFFLNYWVSLGRFYLLDIHCDYSYISPLCGVAQTPDCGMLVIYLSFISPLCGVAQTPDCGIVILFAPFRGVIPDTRSVHSISTPVSHIHILPAYVHHGFRWFHDRRYHHKIFRSMITPCYIIPVFLMFASTFKRTHWLVPGYCLGQIPRLEMSTVVTTYALTCAASRR